MGRTITWLHMSDLHMGKPRSGWDSRRVIGTLVPDLQKMEKDYDFHPDFIFFTGDAAFGQYGTKPNETLTGQYAQVREFFDSVRKAFTREVPESNLFIVPGNHDVNWAAVTPDQTHWLDQVADRDKIYQIIEDKNRQWQLYMERLAEYRKFLESGIGTHLLGDPDRLIYAVVCEVSGLEVGIGGFNSAWSCCRDGGKGTRWMGARWQLEQVHGHLEGVDLSIALVHHPASWLTEEEDPEFGRELERDFHFVLHGHEHTEWVTTNAEGHSRIAAGACYERSDKENGYNFVQLDLEVGQGQVWLRKYEPKGGGWVPCLIHGKTDGQGMWKLDRLDWLKSRASSSPAVTPEEPARGGGLSHREPSAARAEKTELAVLPKATVESPLRVVRLSDLAELGTLPVPLARYEETSGAKQLDTVLVIAQEWQRSIVFPKGGIDWEPIEPSMNYEVALAEKTPWLQELRTEEQIANHFLPLPKFVDQIDTWLDTDRDLLFLALPFCGKTTLLTYLALEASKRRGGNLIPIRLKPQAELTVEKVDVAVVRLKESLEREYKHRKERIVLILDNAHTQEGLEIARRLMTSPRPWRVWAAARPGELFEHLGSAKENPWSGAVQVQNACDLAGETEIDFMVDQVIGPLLMVRGEERFIEQVRETMKEIGQTPVRFLVQVWMLVHNTRGDVDKGYRDLILVEPRGVEEIVRHVMPQSRVGMDALVVADYLRRPSWELLLHVLSAVEGYGKPLAETTVTRLRETLALIKDSEQPCRVTMYDPVRDRIREPGNLTDPLKEQIWRGIEAFLEQGDSIREEGKPEDLVDSLTDLSKLAMEEGRWQIGLGSARRALVYATDENRLAPLILSATCLMNGPVAKWDEVAACERETLRVLPESPAEFRAAVLETLAFSLHSKLEPEWDEAIACYREELELCSASEQAEDRANALYWLAYCLRNKPEPEWDKAIACYREELELRTAPEQAEDRANALHWLAYCLHNKPEPEWDEAIACYHATLKLRTAPEQATGRANTLYWLACCLRNKPEPEWDEAIACYREELELRTAPEQAKDRAYALYWLAYCLHNKPEPEWDEAIACYHAALKLRTAPEQAKERVLTLYWLAHCLHNKPEPKWDEAIVRYRDALVICHAIGERQAEALVGWKLGLAYEKQGDLDRAVASMQVCVDYEREIGHPDAEGDAARVEEIRARIRSHP